METSESQPIAPATPNTLPPSATQPPPPLPSSTPTTEPQQSTSSDAQHGSTPPFSPTSQTPVLQSEQEDFEGTVDVNDDIPSAKDIERVGDMVVLDASGQSRPFRELYDAPHVAPRQLIIFIRHFFCGNCQDFLRTLSSTISPESLLALPTPTFITVIGCGAPNLIPMYTSTTRCSFPVYADPTRKIYDIFGMTRTFHLGTKPAYMQSHMLINSVQSVFQGLKAGKNGVKGGDMKQVGGEFLFEGGVCTWVHRMRNTRDHSEVGVLGGLLGLDGARPPVRKEEGGQVKGGKSAGGRSLSWGRLRSKSRGGKNVGGGNGGMVEEEDKTLVGRPTV